MEAIEELNKNKSNYWALTPISFLLRTANIWPEKTAWVHGAKKNNYKQLLSRCKRIASGLKKRGLKKQDTVAVLLPNVPAMIECHFAIMMAGGILNTINTRLDSNSISFILKHGNAKFIFVDPEYNVLIKKSLEKIAPKDRPIIIKCNDDEFIEPKKIINEINIEEIIKLGDENAPIIWPENEWDSCALNYTSGTTGNPKGVMYHHRGAWLTSISNQMVWSMNKYPIYLWTLPMFHCNGWCFPWTVTALAGTHICLRKVEAKNIYDAIKNHNVTHLCGAPIVLSLLINAKDTEKEKLNHNVKIMTAAAPPPPSILSGIEKKGFEVTHVYGLTEVYGPAVVCEWKEEWNKLDIENKSLKKARQGVQYPSLEELSIRDPNNMQAVPKDGKTIGEVMMRGNMVMKGYYKNKILQL